MPAHMVALGAITLLAAIVNGISSGDAFNVLVLDEASSPTTIGRTLVSALTHTAGSAISRHVMPTDQMSAFVSYGI